MFTPKQWLLIQLLINNPEKPVSIARADMPAYLDLCAKVDGLIAASVPNTEPRPAEPVA